MLAAGGIGDVGGIGRIGDVGGVVVDGSRSNVPRRVDNCTPRVKIV